MGNGISKVAGTRRNWKHFTVLHYTVCNKKDTKRGPTEEGTGSRNKRYRKGELDQNLATFS